MSNVPQAGTLVLGLSGPHSDHCSVGARVMGQLRDEWLFSPAIDFSAAPERGELLVDQIERADSVLIVASVEGDWRSGRITEIDGADLGKLFETLTAIGQTDVVLALAIASWQNRLPENLSMIALQCPRPNSTSTAAPTTEQIDGMVIDMIRRLESWGHAVRRFAPIGVRRHA